MLSHLTIKLNKLAFTDIQGLLLHKHDPNIVPITDSPT